MTTYKITFQRRVNYVTAENEDEAFQRVREIYGDVPREAVEIEAIEQ